MESFSVEPHFNVEEDATRPEDRPVASSFAAAYVEVEETSRPALQSNTEAIFNMLNNALGVSLLATGWVSMQVGLIPAMVMYAISCYLNRYALHLVLRSCQLAKVKVSYPDVARACFGATGFGVCATIMCCQMCSACIAYVVTVGAVLRDESGVLSDRTATMLGAIALVPFTLIRSLKKVAVLSSVATLACVLQMLFVAGGCYSDYFAGKSLVVRADIAPPGLQPEPMKYWNLNLDRLVKVVPVILLSYATQASSPVILASLENDSWENIRRMTGFVYVILYVISFIFGHSVYLRYSNLCTDNALTTIGERPTDAFARWCGLAVVFISYIFMLFPIRNVLMSACLGKDELKREAPYTTFVAMSMCLNCSLLALALGATALGGLSYCLRFGGGFCATLMAMVFPPMLFVQVRADRGWNTRVVCGSKGGLALILAIGTGVWILSNYSLASDILRKISSPTDQ